jgi:hypothetical protein
MDGSTLMTIGGRRDGRDNGRHADRRRVGASRPNPRAGANKRGASFAVRASLSTRLPLRAICARAQGRGSRPGRPARTRPGPPLTRARRGPGHRPDRRRALSGRLGGLPRSAARSRDAAQRVARTQSREETNRVLAGIPLPRSQQPKPDRPHHPRSARAPRAVRGAQEALLGRLLALIFRGLRAEIEPEPRAPRGDQA